GAALLWLGPPGADTAAHVYQRDLFLREGLVTWDNYWYSGRHVFVTYSWLYYPLPSLVGIKLLGALSLAVAARPVARPLRRGARVRRRLGPLCAVRRVSVHARRRVRASRAACAPRLDLRLARNADLGSEPARGPSPCRGRRRRSPMACGCIRLRADRAAGHAR